MKSLLVISNESALAETLASELSAFDITHIRANDMESYLHNKNNDVIIIDGDIEYPLDKEQENIIRLIRPIRLSEAIYTILQKVKSKTIVAKEEIGLTAGYRFLPEERLIQDTDGGTAIALTEKEADLLYYLMKHDNDVLSREALLHKVWGYSSNMNTHTLETHIYRLRSKLKQADPGLDIIFLEEGGYQFKR